MATTASQSGHLEMKANEFSVGSVWAWQPRDRVIAFVEIASNDEDFLRLRFFPEHRGGSWGNLPYDGPRRPSRGELRRLEAQGKFKRVGQL